MTVTLLITALLPVLILLLYIYRKDKMQPEPIGQIVRAFLLGLLTVPLSFLVSVPSEMIGLYSDDVYTVMDAFKISFFGAAIPEEAAKLFVLWLVVRKNKYFDEKMDGIVYAVCVSMGFAAFENVLYLVDNMDSFMQVGISRGLTAVPGHFCFGVVMGYYYSLAAFEGKDRKRNRTLTIAAPVIVHGIYDTILFAATVLIDKHLEISETLAGLISIVFVVGFIYFCFKMWKFGSLKIKQHIADDKVTRLFLDNSQ
ncbi:MAG: PrsW family intramembrane metalloprotease [Bacteroidales bacterium]|nr:PrsW family intramembrane metalloprotease [Bacteroidales bacterium]